MSATRFVHIGSFRSVDAFQAHLREHDIAIPCDRELLAGAESPLGRTLQSGRFQIGNRFAIQPMEGWDGTPDGRPSELTFQRWRNFGRSGAKLIWGGEAVAVRGDGRANPNQLLMAESTLAGLEGLRLSLLAAHKESFGPRAHSDLYVGLQLTHSCRFARPHAADRPEPLVAYAHPILDRRFPAGVRRLADEELDRLVADFVAAARLAQ